MVGHAMRKATAALALLFALVGTTAQAAGQWWWQAYTPNYNGSLTLKDAAGTSVSTTLNPTVTGVKLGITASTMPPVVVVQSTSGTIYSQTFFDNGSFTVPANVTKLTVSLAGGSGGLIQGNPISYGGRGGMRKSIPVTTTPGTNYSIYVGKRGNDYGYGKGGDGCSGGAAGWNASVLQGGVNGANGAGDIFGNFYGVGSGAGPANGTQVPIQWESSEPGGVGNAGGNAGQLNGGGGGGSTCFHNLVACGGGGGSGTRQSDGARLLGGAGSCAGLAGTDTTPGYGDGFVLVEWVQ